MEDANMIVMFLFYEFACLSYLVYFCEFFYCVHVFVSQINE